MLQIKIENEKITRIIDGGKLYDGFTEVPSDFIGRIGDNINFFNKDFSRIDDETLILKGVLPTPEGYKIENNKIVRVVPKGYKLINDELVKMTQVEKINEGLEELPKGLKIVDNKLAEMTQVEKIKAGFEEIPKGYKLINNELIYKTLSEQYKDGDLSKEEYSKYQRTTRDNYLQKTDKYMLPDIPISANFKEKIITYRQQLRDLPQSPMFPDVTIPEPPTE